MERKTAKLAATSFALATVFLTGCAAQSPAPATSAGAEKPVTGGTLRIGETLVNCADPHQRGNNPSSYQLKGLLDNLLAQDPETGEYLPWLASEWDINDEATEFSFTIRDGVTFSDGTPLDAQAVADSVDAVVNKLGAAAPLAIGYLNSYESAEAVDDQEVKFTFSAPNIAFLQGLATGNLGIVSEATSALSAEERCAEGVVGSGPFVIDEWDQNSTLNLVRRDGYAWANPLAHNKGEAYLDGIQVVKVDDPSALNGGLLLSGQIDAYSVVLPQDAPQIEQAGGRIFTQTNGGYPVALVPNLNDPVLKDEAVRKALQIGFDREAVIEGVIGDWFVPSTSALSVTTVGHTDLTDKLQYDPERAKQILDEAGWVVGSDGIREKDGQRLTFDITGEFSWNNSPDIAAIIKEQLKEIGVELELNLLPLGQSPDVYASGDFSTRWVNGYTPEPDTLRAVLGIDDGNWLARTERDELDELLYLQVQQSDVAERNATLAQIQELVIDEGYLIPIYDWAQSFAVSEKVKGDIQLPFLSGPGPIYNDIWLQQ